MGQAGAVEGRLGEAALAQVDWLFAGEQPIAEDAAGPPEDDAAKMVLGVADEHVGDQAGVIELELAKAVGCEERADVAETVCILPVERWRVDVEERSRGDAARK
jgi:hypothetical protein